MDKNSELVLESLSITVNRAEVLFLILEQSSSELKYQENLKLKERTDLEKVHILRSELLFIMLGSLTHFHRVLNNKTVSRLTGDCKSARNVRRTKRKEPKVEED